MNRINEVEMTTTVHVIETTLKDGFPDPAAAGILAAAKEEGFDGITSVSKAAIFRLKGEFDPEILERIASHLLADGITEIYAVDKPVLDESAGQVFEVTFNPGVMDPVQESAHKALRELGIEEVGGIKTGSKFLFRGNVDRSELDTFAGRYLYNKVIQHEVKAGEDPFPVTPAYKFKKETFKLSGRTDEELEKKTPTDFTVGIAGYPEKHPEAPNMRSDIHFLGSSSCWS